MDIQNFSAEKQMEEGRVGWWVAAIALFFLVGGGIAYFITNPPASSGPTVADVARNSDEYNGLALTLKGEMENIKGAHVFMLDEEGPAVGDEVLVLSIPSIEAQGGSSGDFADLEGQDVQVTGTVRKLSAVDIKKETGLDLDPELVLELETRPVLIARQVQFLPEK